MSVHKKIQPNRSSRLAGYREHIYECLVLYFLFILTVIKLFNCKSLKQSINLQN